MTGMLSRGLPCDVVGRECIRDVQRRVGWLGIPEAVERGLKLSDDSGNVPQDHRSHHANAMVLVGIESLGVTEFAGLVGVRDHA